MFGGLCSTNTERNGHSYHFHIGTNDILTKKDPDQIVEGIINLVIRLKRNCEVSISAITEKNDQYQRKTAYAKPKSKERYCKKK